MNKNKVKAAKSINDLFTNDDVLTSIRKLQAVQKDVATLMIAGQKKDGKLFYMTNGMSFAEAVLLIETIKTNIILNEITEE
jgi:hypothetical protein